MKFMFFAALMSIASLGISQAFGKEISAGDNVYNKIRTSDGEGQVLSFYTDALGTKYAKVNFKDSKYLTTDIVEVRMLAVQIDSDKSKNGISIGQNVVHGVRLSDGEGQVLSFYEDASGTEYAKVNFKDSKYLATDFVEVSDLSAQSDSGKAARGISIGQSVINVRSFEDTYCPEQVLAIYADDSGFEYAKVQFEKSGQLVTEVANVWDLAVQIDSDKSKGGISIGQTVIDVRSSYGNGKVVSFYSGAMGTEYANVKFKKSSIVIDVQNLAPKMK
jgi:hypothetical protein